MKINQVEELVGITKKNIRFYEEEGLLEPDRNPENGYREYSLKDVQQLEKIKLLRMLAIPLEEIRLLQNGKISFEESMNRQIVRFEEEQENSQRMGILCSKLKSEILDFNNLDASFYLSEMKKMESQGSKFIDVQREDVIRKEKKGTILAASLFCLFFLGSLIPVAVLLFIKENLIWGTVIIITIAIIICCGIFFVLIQRLKEINRGEKYEARNY